MDETAIIESVLDKMRKTLQHDGGGLVLKSWQDGVVEADIVLESDACEECVMDSKMLSLQLDRLLKKELRSVKKVVINDPRDK
jgi:Fe-S cluster biogenesis protein NfuA